MKNILLIIILLALYNRSYACGPYSEVEEEYYHFYNQEIIPNKDYFPFLLDYTNPFYESNDIIIKDENSEAWQKYFNNTFDYTDMDAIVKLVDIKHLQNLKKGKRTHKLFSKLPDDFYSQYKEGIDYLIEAKYLEPYMHIVPDENENYYYYSKEIKNVSNLDFNKISKDLLKLYKVSKNNEIKLRYGFQLVRFYHYNRKYKQAISAFDKYVEPIKENTPIYWYALSQKAGAESGLQKLDDSNFDFFQVFFNSRNKKVMAYQSIKFHENVQFESLLQRCKTTEEKCGVYFLLAYNDFNNPIPIMQKIYEIDPNSPFLKVITARTIKSFERNNLLTYYDCRECKEEKKTRIPTNDNALSNLNQKLSLSLIQFINQPNIKQDSFWLYSLAYAHFINSDYKTSESILNQISVEGKLYRDQIKKLSFLNRIVSTDKITSDFENELFNQYHLDFESRENIHYDSVNKSVGLFIQDILANRYFLQGDYGKSFMIHNKISSLQEDPNMKLTQEIEKFCNKANKNNLENLIFQYSNDMDDYTSFFNVIYGDNAMRNANFQLAKKYYEKVKNYEGKTIYVYEYGDNKYRQTKAFQTGPTGYDGFHNISSLIFGHNVQESFSSPAQITMKPDFASEFTFIIYNMDKLELAKSLIKLEEIAKSDNPKSASANQLIGNVLYNTSKTGYYREIFTMNITNDNSEKHHFSEKQPIFNYYYKNYEFPSYVNNQSNDYAEKYYKKALEKSVDNEQKARILFQLASCEQEKFYEKEGSNDDYEYDYSSRQFEGRKYKPNKNFTTYFEKLKSNYSNTSTFKKLKSSCLYFNYYAMK